jgi:putative phosphoesterase
LIVGVMSDTHDRVPAIEAALDLFNQHGVKTLIHAGDIVAPFAAKALARFTAGPIHVVYGNNDGERRGLAAVLPQIKEGPAHLDLGGARILVHHFIDWCERTDIDRADIIITGHTHAVVNERRGDKLYLNPGECCGWVSRKCTAALLDMTKRSARVMELDL